MIKKNLFYFLSNEYLFYFLSNHYFNKFISSYSFNYKNLIIFLKLYLFINNNFFKISLRKMRCYTIQKHEINFPICTKITELNFILFNKIFFICTIENQIPINMLKKFSNLATMTCLQNKIDLGWELLCFLHGDHLR